MKAMAAVEGLAQPTQVSVGKIIYPPGSTLGPRVQPSLQLVMVHSGSVNLWLDGQPRYLPKTSVCLLFPGHQEYFAFDKELPTQHSWLHIYLPQAGLKSVIELRPFPDLLPLSAQMLELTELALTLPDSPLVTAQAMLKALALQMLYLYLGEAEHSQSGLVYGSQLQTIEGVQQYIRSHLSEELPLRELAAAGNVSQTHLIRLFRRHLASTPLEYVWQRRIAYGIELLLNTGLSVRTISERCGFQTTHHFARRIKQQTGLSPRELRKQGWQNGNLPALARVD